MPAPIFFDSSSLSVPASGKITRAVKAASQNNTVAYVNRPPTGRGGDRLVTTGAAMGKAAMGSMFNN